MSSNLFNPTRRQLLQGTAALAAAGIAGVRPSFAVGIDWKRFAGTKLDVNLVKGPRSDNLLKYLAEFTELTGIKVNPSRFPSSSSARRP